MKTRAKPKPKTDQETLDEVQADLPDLIKSATELLETLQTADCAETESDVDANLDDAKDIAVELLREIRRLRHKLGGYD